MCADIIISHISVSIRSADAKTAETEALAYVAPDNLRGKPYDEKT